MIRIFTALTALLVASSVQADHSVVDFDNPVIAGKRLVYALTDVAEEAKEQVQYFQTYDRLAAAKLKFAASRAEKLATQVYVKIVVGNARGALSKAELVKAYKSLAHDIKNYQNAVRKVKHLSHGLQLLAHKVEMLLEDLEELALGRGRIGGCRGNRCLSR